MGKFDDALRMAVRPRNASQVAACETVLMQEFMHVLMDKGPRKPLDVCMSELPSLAHAVRVMPDDMYYGTWRMLYLYVEHPSPELLAACEGDEAHAKEAIEGVIGAIMALRHAKKHGDIVFTKH